MRKLYADGCPGFLVWYGLLLRFDLRNHRRVFANPSIGLRTLGLGRLFHPPIRPKCGPCFHEGTAGSFLLLETIEARE